MLIEGLTTPDLALHEKIIDTIEQFTSEFKSHHGDLTPGVIRTEQSVRRALSEDSNPYAWARPANLVVDPAGPWWAALVRRFDRLEKGHQDWILDRIQPASAKGATWLNDRIVEQEWTWAWSEVPLVDNWSPVRTGNRSDHHYPDVGRADLVLGDLHRAEIVDFKVLTNQIHWTTAQQRDRHKRLFRYYELLVACGFPKTPNYGGLVLLDPDGKLGPKYEAAMIRGRRGSAEDPSQR